MNPLRFFYDSNQKEPIPTNKEGYPIFNNILTPGMESVLHVYVRNTIPDPVTLDFKTETNSDEISFENIPITINPGQNSRFRIKFNPKIDRVQTLRPRILMSTLTG